MYAIKFSKSFVKIVLKWCAIDEKGSHPMRIWCASNALIYLKRKSHDHDDQFQSLMFGTGWFWFYAELWAVFFIARIVILFKILTSHSLGNSDTAFSTAKLRDALFLEISTRQFGHVATWSRNLCTQINKYKY
jgi:hypothetical protein